MNSCQVGFDSWGANSWQRGTAFWECSPCIAAAAYAHLILEHSSERWIPTASVLQRNPCCSALRDMQYCSRSHVKFLFILPLFQSSRAFRICAPSARQSIILKQGSTTPMKNSATGIVFGRCSLSCLLCWVCMERAAIYAHQVMRQSCLLLLSVMEERCSAQQEWTFRFKTQYVVENLRQ